MNPPEALAELKAGNARFAAGNLEHPNLHEDRQKEMMQTGQTPFAAVLSCADSRAPVEIVFDQGLGDIFTVRNAGNVCDDTVVGSLELGVFKFGIPLLVVMGHTDCGAVKLAVGDDTYPGKIQDVLNHITPVADMIRVTNPSITEDELIPLVTKANTLQSIGWLLEDSTIISDRVKQGELRIIPAIHHLDTGEVEWLEE